MRLDRLAAGAGLAWVGWRLFGPEIPPRFSGPQVLPAAPTGRTVRAAHHEFLVREAGAEGSPPLFLIHGWAYDSFATWHRIAPRLAARFHVVAPDQRNHGKSDHIRERYDVADAADDMAAVLDALQLAAVPVVGYSMGGMVAQELARRHPGRVSRLVLVATAAYPVPHRRRLIRSYLFAAKGIGRVSMRESLWLSHRYLLRSGVVSPQHARWLWESLRHRDVDLYVEAGKAIWRFDSRNWVDSLRAPARVIIPADDQLIPVAAQRELARLLQVDAVVLEGARHEAMLTHADEIAAAIEGFV